MQLSPNSGPPLLRGSGSCCGEMITLVLARCARCVSSAVRDRYDKIFLGRAIIYAALLVAYDEKDSRRMRLLRCAYASITACLDLVRGRTRARSSQQAEDRP